MVWTGYGRHRLDYVDVGYLILGKKPRVHHESWLSMDAKRLAKCKKREVVRNRMGVLLRQRMDLLFFGFAGLSLFISGLYLAQIWNTNHLTIRFQPEDIIYGQTLLAQHPMDGRPFQNTPTTTNVGSGDHPQMQVSDSFFDFGSMNASQVVSRTFVIANTGNAPLIISQSYTTCGCTTAWFTAVNIPPGKVALMTLHFDAGYHNVRGYTVRRGVVILTNDFEHPIQEIWIQASVR